MDVDRLPLVAVLLAACNGEQWIAEQVDSILQQQGVRVRLCISVDAASEDGTLEWCRAMAVQEPRVSLLPWGERFGRAGSHFFHLLRVADFHDCDAVALADQDDVWLPQHLAGAVQLLQEQNLAACSANVLAFWPNGRQELIDKARPQRRYDYLFEAAGPGCSYVMRSGDALALADFLREQHAALEQVWLHDWLIYAWFRATGRRWQIRPQVQLRYRQHAHNHLGVNSGLRAALVRLRMLRQGWYRRQIGTIVRVLRPWLPELPDAMLQGRVPPGFVLANAAELRRHPRDRWILLMMLLCGLY